MKKVRMVLLVVLAIISASCISSCRTARLHEIPEGCRGWIVIWHSKADCPPLSKDDGRLVLQIPPNGRSCTSTSLTHGLSSDVFMIVGLERRVVEEVPHGSGEVALWGLQKGACSSIGSGERQFEAFFLGTEADFQAARMPDWPCEERKAP